jgi:predicted nucleotidyltransferase
MPDLSLIDNAVKTIIKNIEPQSIILFGSYANGTNREDSDIDLFIVKDIPEDKVREIRISIRYLLKDIQLKNKISYDVLIDSKERIDYRINVVNDPFYQEVFRKGKVVYVK